MGFSTLDVLVVGGSGVDTIVRVPRLDMPVADSHMVPMVHTRAGHTGDNVALGCHALGLSAHLVDVIGDDTEGRLVRELHAAAGLTTDWGSTATTKRAANLVDDEGRRMSFYDSRGEADVRLAEELWLEHANRARHVHVSITHPSQFVMRGLPTGPTVSTDLHNWDGANPHHLQFAAGADLVFMSVAALGDPGTGDTDTGATTGISEKAGEAMRRVLELGRPRLVIATAGAVGCYLLTKAGDTPEHFPAEPIPGEAVDSNGAGDAFVAGFIYGQLRGEPLTECIRLGAVAGAYACTLPATETRPLTLEQLTAMFHVKHRQDGSGASSGC